MTKDELKEKMKDKPIGSQEYKNFAKQEFDGKFAAYWDPNDETFYTIGGRSNIWLAGGGDASFGQHEWGWHYKDSDFGFSGRLLKN